MSTITPLDASDECVSWEELEQMAERAVRADPTPTTPEERLYTTTMKLERALLGAVLTVGLLPKQPPRPEDFALEAHRVTWLAVLAVAARGDAPEILPVTYELDKTRQLERAGGAVYVAGHLDSTDCSDLAQYGRLVKEASLIRKMNRLKA
jgi:replicative DNA helicase